METTAHYCQEHGCSMCLFAKKGTIKIEGKKICEDCGGNKKINDWIFNEESLNKDLKTISQNFYDDIEPVKTHVFSLKKGILKKEIKLNEVKTIFSLIDYCPLETKKKNDWKEIYKGIQKKGKLINKVFLAEKHFLLNLARERKQNEQPTPNPTPIPPNSPPSPNIPTPPNPTPPNQPNDVPTPEKPNSPNQPEKEKDEHLHNEERCKICNDLRNDLSTLVGAGKLIIHFPEISQIYFQVAPEKFHAKIKEIEGLLKVKNKESTEIKLIAKKEKEVVKKVAQEKGINNFFIGQICLSCRQELEQKGVIFEPEHEKKPEKEKIMEGIKMYQELRKELEKEIGKEKIEELDRKIRKFLKQKEEGEKIYKPATDQKEKKFPAWGIMFFLAWVVAIVAGIYYLMNKKKKRKLTQFILAN